MFNVFRSSIIRAPAYIRSLATTATATTSTTATTAASSEVFPNAIKPKGFSIATLRSFPSLEPHSIFPVHNELVNQPLRRDILWLAVVMELDNKRVGASNPPGRSQHKFSRKKLFKQKGTGRARVGDANSPIRFRGAYALARQAPNDFSTKLTRKTYDLAYRIAISDLFRKGKLNIIGKDESFISKYEELSNEKVEIKEYDSFDLEIKTPESLAISQFVKSNKFENLNLLFIVNDYFKVENLRKAVLRYPSKKLVVLQQDEVEVRHLLKANQIFIEKPAFDYLAAKYTKFVNLD